MKLSQNADTLFSKRVAMKAFFLVLFLVVPHVEAASICSATAKGQWKVASVEAQQIISSHFYTARELDGQMQTLIYSGRVYKALEHQILNLIQAHPFLFQGMDDGVKVQVAAQLIAADQMLILHKECREALTQVNGKTQERDLSSFSSEDMTDAVEKLATNYMEILTTLDRNFPLPVLTKVIAQIRQGKGIKNLTY